MNIYKHYIDSKQNTDKTMLSVGEIAKLLNTTPEALQEFEKAYKVNCLGNEELERKSIGYKTIETAAESVVTHMCKKIIQDLVSQTSVYAFDGDLSHAAAMEIRTEGRSRSA